MKETNPSFNEIDESEQRNDRADAPKFVKFNFGADIDDEIDIDDGSFSPNKIEEF